MIEKRGRGSIGSSSYNYYSPVAGPSLNPAVRNAPGRRNPREPSSPAQRDSADRMPHMDRQHVENRGSGRQNSVRRLGST